MYCKKCGNQLNDGAAFCQECGERVNAVQGGQDFRQGYVQNPVGTGKGTYKQYDTFPMKWHKFLIYFSLWAGAVINAISGIIILTGKHYGDVDASYIYAFFPKMQAADIVYGIISVAVAVMAVYTRFMLAGYRKTGPTMLTIPYAVALTGTILYIVMIFIAVGAKIAGEMINASTISSILTSIVMICVNTVYYKKRESLFIN